LIQHTHNSTSFQQKKFPVILFLDGVQSPANLGSLLRLADAFNIEKILYTGSTIDMDSNRLKRTSRGTHNTVKCEEVKDALEACDSLSQEGYNLFALEITTDSSPIESLNYSGFEKVVLILGNERSGIKEELLIKADKRVHINMFGQNSSMNVAQAAGIALFEITKSLQAVT
jgi:tRNA G18 (ribose-2'-O)-methylase SpoU